MESIEAFCDRYDACGDGKKWALKNCSTMDDVWERAKPEWLIWVATRDGVLDDKTLRLFACFCARQIWPLLEDERSRNAVLVSEKFADGDATEDDLDAAWVAAWDAVWDAAWVAARDAAWVAARVAAWYAVWDVAWVAARAAAFSTSRDAALINQAKWLRENAKPNFEVKQ